MIHIIGCGGGGSWLTALMVKISRGRITLWDGDILEKRNLDRQLFSEEDIGKNKAQALAEKYPRVMSTPVYMTEVEHAKKFNRGDVIFLCVDNHRARLAALNIADARDCYVINAANEYTDAEAWVYFPEQHKGTPIDPRVRSPEILTDRTGDPTYACTGEAQEAAPQLALANMGSAFMAAHLWYMYFVHLQGEDVPWDVLPVQHGCNWAKTQSYLGGHFIDALSERE